MNEADLSLLMDAAKKGGAIAKSFYDKGGAKVWDKTKGHPVTEADIAVNDYLKTELLAARADYGWLSEETKDDASRQRAARSFVIDPIDGTRAFIDRRPHFTLSLAVIERGLPVAAVIYNPLTFELYGAYKGGGAWLNDKKLVMNDKSALKNCTMIGYPRKFKRLGWPDMRVKIRNSMAYRMALTASDFGDATVSFTPKSDWDVAAGALIVSEAGGVATDLSGAALRFDEEGVSKKGVICAGPTLHGLILQLVKTTVLQPFAQGEPARNQIIDKLETKMSDRKKSDTPDQLLHLVIGGELVDPNKTEFINLKEVVFVGAYPNYAAARDAWKSAAQSTVDNAHMRFFVLHAHELIDPDNDGFIG